MAFVVLSAPSPLDRLTGPQRVTGSAVKADIYMVACHELAYPQLLSGLAGALEDPFQVTGCLLSQHTSKLPEQA